MKIFIHFPALEFHQGSYYLDVQSDVQIPSAIINESIFKIISSSLSISTFIDNLHSLLPIFSYICGCGRMSIASDCSQVVLSQKRSCRIKLPSYLDVNKQVFDQYLLTVAGENVDFFFPESAWNLSCQSSTVQYVLSALKTESDLNWIFNFVNHSSFGYDLPGSTSPPAATSIKTNLFDKSHIAFSRKGFDVSKPIGATFPYSIPPPPLEYTPQKVVGTSIPIPLTDLSYYSQKSYINVLCQRRSMKSKLTDNFLSYDDLVEFLNLVFHTSNIFRRSPDITNSYDACQRLYPNGGGVHELEPFIVCNRVTNIKNGIYHFSPFSSRLSPISYDQNHIKSLISEAYFSSNKESIPAAFIILASRLQRLTWKYERMAYHVTLKNTGVLLGYMSQVASFLDLYGCPMGNSDSLCFSRIIDEDPFQMPAVGEFCLSPHD